MDNKFEYILSQFRNYYSVPNFIKIGYGINPNQEFNIYINQQVNSDFFKNKQGLSFSIVKWIYWKDKKIPLLFGMDNEDLFTEKGSLITINFDLIASAFYLLSGWHEYVSSTRDKFGRIAYSDSIERSLDIIEIPVVNYYFDILRTAIEKAYNIRLQSKFENYDYRVCLTHDIDKLKKSWDKSVKQEIIKKKFLSALLLTFKKLVESYNLKSIIEILEIEKKQNVVSTFFFLIKKGKYLGCDNGDYSILSKYIIKIISKLECDQYALHASYGSHINSLLLKNEQSFFNKIFPIKGNRFHFLAFDPKHTPSILQSANFAFDSSISFAEHSGFRRSICYPYYIYDLKNDQSTNVLEIPLNIMDTTFQKREYMNIPADEISLSISNLIEEVKKFNGVLTVLWHNTNFASSDYREWKIAYEKCICQFKNDQIHFSTCQEITDLF